MSGTVWLAWSRAARRAAGALAILLALASPARADDAGDCERLSGDAAMAACSRVIAKDGKAFRALAQRGFFQLTAGQVDKALADLNQSLALQPGYTYALLLRGKALGQKGEVDRALADFDRAVALQPKVGLVRNLRGTFLADIGRYARAIEDFDEAIRLEPENTMFLVNRGIAYEFAGDYDRAIENYGAVIALKPDDPRTFWMRGAAWTRKGQADKAIADYDRAIALDPKDAGIFHLRGQALEMTGDLERALADFRSAVRLDPADARYSSEVKRVEIAIARLATASRPSPSAEPAPAPLPPERRVALVIGNAAYGAGGRLKNPVNDARDVSQVLTSLGFEVTLAEDLDRTRFGRTLAAFEERAAGADAVLFYYAGHGIGLAGESYLVPTDADYRSVGEVKESAIRLSETLERFKGRARIILAFVDACRDTPLVDRLAATSPVRSAGLQRGLALLDVRDPDILLVYATTPGRTAADGAGRNSPFSGAFIGLVRTPGVEVETLLKRIARKVMDDTGNRQVPERLSRLTTEFYFRPQGAGVP